jgi:multimeric flavodoxin WrbA
MLEAVLAGARDDTIEGVEVVVRPALTASVVDALEADGYLLGTPANIGYISGALKHFFDTIYYPCLEHTRGRPFATYLHGNLGAEGAERAIDVITTGLKWRAVAATITVVGAPTATDRAALYDLGGTIAATLAEGAS